MKPTMPMSAFPSQPGYGPPSSAGWGPPAAAPPPPPPKKSKAGLYVGLGCGCALLLTCAVGIVALAFAGKGVGGLFGPGEEVASTQLVVGQPFTLRYVQDGAQKYEAWLEVDLEHTGGYALASTVLLSENGTAFGQYTLQEDGEGDPVVERTGTTRINWVSTTSPGGGSVSGTVSLFPVPARTPDAQIALSGTVQAPPGTTGTLRLFVAKRD